MRRRPATPAGPVAAHSYPSPVQDPGSPCLPRAPDHLKTDTHLLHLHPRTHPASFPASITIAYTTISSVGSSAATTTAEVSAHLGGAMRRRPATPAVPVAAHSDPSPVPDPGSPCLTRPPEPLITDMHLLILHPCTLPASIPASITTVSATISTVDFTSAITSPFTSVGLHVGDRLLGGEVGAPASGSVTTLASAAYPSASASNATISPSPSSISLLTTLRRHLLELQFVDEDGFWALRVVRCGCDCAPRWCVADVIALQFVDEDGFWALSYQHKVSDNLPWWPIVVVGAPGMLYSGVSYQLQVDFPEHYPMAAPQLLSSPIAVCLQQGVRVPGAALPFWGLEELAVGPRCGLQVVSARPGAMMHLWTMFVAGGWVCALARVRSMRPAAVGLVWPSSHGVWDDAGGGCLDVRSVLVETVL